jgi:hypothetical protein
MTRIRHALPAACALALAAAGFAAPAPAAQDGCADRIRTVQERLNLVERVSVEGPVLEQADAIQEDGGTTAYAETGPATPRENWFGDSPDRAAALAELEDAMAAREAGNMQRCQTSIQEAQRILDER